MLAGIGDLALCPAQFGWCLLPTGNAAGFTGFGKGYKERSETDGRIHLDCEGLAAIWAIGFLHSVKGPAEVTDAKDRKRDQVVEPNRTREEAACNRNWAP